MMADRFAVLKNEIDADPLARGYAGMTDQQVADSLNDTIDRVRFRSDIPPGEVFAALDLAEYKALAAAERDAFLLVVTLPAVDATDSNTRTLLGTIFPNPSTTRSNLLALAQETVSRAVELELGRVLPGRVAMARAA